MTAKNGSAIPKTYEDLLGSKAHAHVATVGPQDHRPVDQRVVVFVGPEHTAQMGS